MTTISEPNRHYDAAYWAKQRVRGAFGGSANLIKFTPYIRETDRVADFGAGGGYLLEHLRCADKIGVEINPDALADARRRGLRMVESLDAIEDGSIDVFISDNALEHVEAPFDVLQKVYRKLTNGGRAIFVVPCEGLMRRFRPSDFDMHLYSWSPNCLGNLFVRAGFSVVECTPFIHKWPPRYAIVQKILGWPLFHVICRIWARMARSWFQVRCVARKGPAARQPREP